MEYMKICIIALFGSILGGFLFLLIALIWNGPMDNGLIAAHALIFDKPNKDLTAEELRSLYTLLNNGSVISPSDLLSELTSFYETIINILIIITTMLGVVAFMYIKGSSRDHAEKITKETVKDYLKNKVEKEIEDKISGLEILRADLEDSLNIDEIKSLNEKMKTLKNQVARLDKEEMELQERKLTE